MSQHASEKYGHANIWLSPDGRCPKADLISFSIALDKTLWVCKYAEFSAHDFIHPFLAYCDCFETSRAGPTIFLILIRSFVCYTNIALFDCRFICVSRSGLHDSLQDSSKIKSKLERNNRHTNNRSWTALVRVGFVLKASWLAFNTI